MGINGIDKTTPILDRRYSDLNQIGAGSMGIVYSARDRLTDQTVAIKSVFNAFTLIEGGSTAFDNRLALAEEFQTLASLRHPNIISVIDYGFDADRQPFFTMDLLEQRQTLLQSAQPLPFTAKIELLVQALHAVSYIHRRGIVHRDLKPGNILVQNGQVKLLDFGLATVKEQEGVVVGTPAYMAPEVLIGYPATPSADLYALGVILYQMFTGSYPFDMLDLNHLLADVLRGKPDMTPFSTNPTRVLSASDLAIDPSPEPTADEHGAPQVTPTVWLSAEHRARHLSDVTEIDVMGTLNEAVKAAHSIVQQETPQPAPADPTGALGRIADRLLSRNPVTRYQSAVEVIRDLEALIGRPMPMETSAARDSLLKAARFVGRQKEIDTLLALLMRAFDKSGSTMLVSGENGVGKTRLLDELRIRGLVSGAFVVRGRAAELDAPYQMWREPLRRLIFNTTLNDYDASVLKEILADMDDLIDRPVPLAPAMEPDQGGKRLSAVIVSLFSRQTQPILLLLEDLHWARSENLAVLEALSQSLSTCPILIVGSYRNDEQSELAPLLRTLPTLHLDRFTPNEIAALTESMLGPEAQHKSLHEFMERETEGNALFIVEVLHTLAEETGDLRDIGVATLPRHFLVEGIQRLLQRRVARLAEVDRPLLQIAALIGREIDVSVLSAAEAERDIEAWLLTCSELAILEFRNEHWQFSHDKLRQEVLRELTAEDAPDRNRRAAEALEAAHSNPGDYAPLLMRLWAAAGNTRKEREYAIRAGQQAYQATAYNDAMTYLQRANTLLLTEQDSDTEAQCARVLVELAKCQTHLNNYGEAIRLAEASLALQVTAQTPSIHADALYSLGYGSLFQGDPATASTLLEQSLVLYRQTADPRGIAESLRGLARISSAQGNYQAGLTYLEESLRNSQQAHNVWDEAKAYLDLGYIRTMQGVFEQAQTYLETCQEMFRTVNNRIGTANSLLLLGMIAHFRSEPARATDYLLKSLAISREIGDQRAAADALNNLGSYASARGEFVEAEGWLTQSLEIYEGLNFRWGVAATLVNLGHAATGRKNIPRAKAYFREALQQASELHATPLMLESIAGFAVLVAAEGDAPRALNWIGLVNHHPANNPDIKAITDPLLAAWSAKLPAEELAQYLEMGQTVSLDDAVAAILAG